MTRSNLAVFTQVNETPMGSASVKKEVQEQETLGYACFLPKMTAHQQNKATPSMEKQKQGGPP